MAIKDLRSIHDYIKSDSKSYADKFIAKVIERVTQLEGFPQSGRIVPEFNSMLIQELIIGNYRIVYKIEPDNVGILRVHHAARQLEI